MTLARARAALDGLSVGDAFGERFFVHPSQALALVEARALPRAPWSYTDDTVMAAGLLEVLSRQGRVEQDELARVFARNYARDPARGYGGLAHGILQAIGGGAPWRDAASSAYGGEGSMGNGAAMRVAPLGALFAGDPERVAHEARLSAEVTHAHPDGAAGAIAVAVAAGFAAERSAAASSGPVPELLDAALAHTPPGPTRDGLLHARALPFDRSAQLAAQVLGNGSRVVAFDTVPFALWCAARHLGDYEEALWATVSGLGDRDTTCAIVGGILAASPDCVVPEAWLAAREPLDAFRG